MKENLLDIWSSKMKEYVWRHGLINQSPYSDIERIKENLLFFFGAKIFEYEKIFPLSDQLYALLSSSRLSSLFKLAEVSSTIDFYRKNPTRELLPLHGNRRKLSYDEIQGRFFELFINKILIENKFTTNTVDLYKDDKNISHPIDISIEFQKTKYLIECYKVGNPKKQLFSKLINDIIKYSLKFSQNLRPVEMFSGYFIFKTEPITPDIIQHSSIVFKKALSEYFAGFRDQLSRVTKLDYQFENSFIQLKLFSNFVSSNFDLAHIQDKKTNSLIFRTIVEGETYGNVTLDFSPMISHKSYKEHLIDKIRDKKRQHKDSPIKNKLIIVEFENIKDNNLYQGSIPITKNEVNQFNFNKLIDINTSIIFWIKTIDSSRYTTSIGIAAYSSFNKDLKTKLLNLKINWK